MAINFAFDSEEISIAFKIVSHALGDTVISKAAFEALVKLAPDCKIDIYCKEGGRKCVESFYGDDKNINALVDFDLYKDQHKKYDLAVNVWHLIRVDFVNVDKLQDKALDLFRAVQKMLIFQNRYPYKANNNVATILTNVMRSHILGTNRYTVLSCAGALPITDDHVNIPLTAEGEAGFKDLNLPEYYITMGSNTDPNNNLSKRFILKEWPITNATEFISLFKKHFTKVAVVQMGGGDAFLFENADRHVLNAPLEVVKHVLKNSLLHIDCEGGLVHLATQFRTKCITLFGPTDTEYYGFKGNFNVATGDCFPCCHAWDSGAECLRGEDEPLCMKSIKPERVFDIAKNYLLSLAKNKA